MTKIERMRAVLSGRPADQTPFSLWYHFGNQHASAELTARIHLDFFEAYDLDFLKVMNDYDYPMPDGMDYLATPEDLCRISLLDMRKTPMGAQLEVIERIAKEQKGKAFFIDTVFNAWYTLRRNMAKEAMPRLMSEYPDAVERALGIINQNLIQFALSSLEQGSDGIFYAVPATAESVTPQQFERFIRPLDLEFLNAIRDKGEFHILHVHGEKLYFDRILDYPVHAISWADLNGGPSIAEARKLTSLALIAGLDHVRFPFVSTKIIRDQAKKAMEQAGPSKFILAPGCTVHSFAFPPLIKAARDAARRHWR
jgi:uroporphyrinogen decarboxylase